ncbi:hypothetical protein [Frondihabitans sp. PhB188]|uniref:hypothetical protein n=1 Tax=Frondihabitans sp. PhB188 TaxID=2485200 RepID=UPI0011CE120D|nr:hypothetical protein [Frondihabitans sp. PhB188]
MVVALGLGGSAGLSAVGVFDGVPNVLISLAAGVALASIAAWILMTRWRPKLTKQDRYRSISEWNDPRPAFQGLILSSLGACGIVVAFMIGMVGVVIGREGNGFGAFGALFAMMIPVVNAVTFVRRLGQTLVSLPEKNPGQDQPRASKPYRQLGTDHPDDYKR